MQRRQIGSLSILALALATSAFAGTLTYDVTADWQNNSNPNGAWSYLAGSTLLPYQSGLGAGTCFQSAGGIGGGYAPGVNFGNNPPCLPAMFLTTGASNTSGLWDAGDVVIHAQDPSNGAGQGQSSIVWTAQESGTITFSGAVWYAHGSLQRSDDWSLSLNTTTLANGSVAWNSAVGNSRSNILSFSGTNSVAVSAGDQVKFLLTGSAGSTGALAGLQLTITETTADSPEPATLALSFAGLGLIAGLRRRARRA